MNSDPLSELWNSAANRHDPAEGERIAVEVLVRLRRRRRVQAWWLAWTSAALSVTTAIALVQVTGDKEGASAPSGLWVMVPLLVVPWCVAAHFLRAFFREKRPSARASQPLRDVLGAMRESNTRERRRLLVVLALLAAMAPLTALAVHHLQQAGKLEPNEAVSMALVFALGLALGGAAVVLRLRFRLQPERRRVESLLRDFEPNTTE